MARADPMTIVVVDGEPLAFASELAALQHARELQPGGRVGVAAGAEQEATAVAAQLCAQAAAGQVLVSHPVRSAAAEHGWQEFRELGTLQLEDGGAPVRTWELLWREPGPRTQVSLCGPLALTIEGRELAPELPGGQASALLAYLLDRPERAASREELIAVTWPDSPPRDPGAALRPILSRLRRALEPATLEGRERLRLTLPEPVRVDVEEAAAAIEAARSAAKLGDWESVRAGAEAALALLGPGFLPGQEAEWIEERRRELEERELEALEWLARSGLALGGPELARAEHASRELIARSPYRETGHRFLIEALAAGGNAAEALRAYEELRVLLREELGAAPAAELQSLHQRLLGSEEGAPAPSAAATPAAPRRVALPSVLAPRGESAFVGRDRELAALSASWEQARAGRRRLALVAGEPGIGKTRIMSELALLAQRDGTVLYAGCQEEALVSYQPFVEALRHYARSAELDWSQVALGAGAGELALMVPELAAALPQEGAAPAADPETRRYLLFEAVSTLLTTVSQRAPLLLVLDDLHWADRATLHLLRHTIRSSQEGSLLIVGAYRDAEIGPEHPLADLLADLRRDRLFDRVSLDGLDAGGVNELIALHAGHAAPAALVETVHEHTEGNPFFVEEVMRHLIETGVLFERGGRWTSALTADEIGVPEGVRDVLGGRLGRLSEECRGALAAGAVLGREFRFETLRAMDVGDEETLIAALEEAVEAQLVVEASGGGATHGFTHALVREALYSDLSGPRRQRMHARAAAALEATSGEPPIAALAVQYRLAGAAGDPEKAVAYSVRAGAEAAGISAWEEAAAHWEGALAVMAGVGGHERERAELNLPLADLLGVAGEVGRQIACLEEALTLFEGLGDAERTAQAHSRLGSAYSLIDSIYADHMDLNVAFRHFDAARAVFEQGPPRRALGHLEGGVAAALTYGVQTERGIEAGARAMEIGERTGDEVLWAKGAESGGWHLIVSGQLGAGFAQMERALEVVDRERRALLAWMALNIRGQMSWGLGSPDESQSFFERHIALPYVGETSFRQETADGVGRCHFSRGELGPARALLSDARPAWMTHALKPLIDLWDGRWDEVAALAARTLETSRRNGNRWDEWSSQHLAARVHQLRGEDEPALENLERALAIVEPGGARYFELWVRIDLVRTNADGGRTEAARRHLDRCLEIVGNGEDWRGRAGQVALAEAVVLAAEGRGDEAEAGFAAALARFQRYRLRGEEADALHQWGRALARGGSGAEAAEKLDAAAALYSDHGAGERWLALVEADRR